MPDTTIKPEINADFEQSVTVEDDVRFWHRKTFNGSEWGNMMVPLGWTSYWREGCEIFKEDHVPWDPTNTRCYVRPEMNVIPATAPFLKPPRILTGQHALQYHATWAIYDAGVYTQINCQPGDIINFSAFAHGWSTNNSSDPYHSQVGGDAENQLEFFLGVDPMGATAPWSDGVIWTDPVLAYDVYDKLQTRVIAMGTKATLYLRSRAKWRFRNVDSYWDNVNVTLTRPVERRGPRPEWTHKKTLWVPTFKADGSHITEEDYVRAARWAARHNFMDFSQSLDASVWGPEVPYVEVVVGNLSPGHMNEDEAQAWIDVYYPSVGAKVVGTANLYDPAGGGTTEPPEPEPEPEPEPQPPTVHELRTKNVVGGLHYRGVTDAMRDYVRSANPPAIIKTIHPGELVKLGIHVPNHMQDSVLKVFRKYVHNDGEWVHRSNLQESANAFLGLIEAELQATAEGLGQSNPEWGIFTVEDVLKYVDAVEGLNEVMGTYDAETPMLIDWVCYFMEAVERRFGDLTRAAVLAIPIGNPALDEFPKMDPALKMMHERGHYFGHHQAYWASLRQGERYCGTVPADHRVINFAGWSWVLDQVGGELNWRHVKGYTDPADVGPLETCWSTGLVRYFPWLAGRWMLYDDYARSKGWDNILHYAGEGGLIVGHGSAGPGEFGSRPGWRDVGSWQFTMQQFEWITAVYNAWNQRFGNRFRGVSWFTNVWWGWESFWIDEEQIRAWLQWAQRQG